MKAPRKRPTTRRSCTSGPSFNGAAVKAPRKLGILVRGEIGHLRLQWSRGEGTAETTRRLRPRQIHPTLQWSRGEGTAETSQDRLGAVGHRSFNGAAVKAPRKHAPEGSRPVGVIALQWSRGEGTAETLTPASWMHLRALRFNGAAVKAPRKRCSLLAGHCLPRSFNGAAVKAPRKRCRPAEEKTPAAGLQWSRGEGTAETKQRPRRTPLKRKASMEPR